MYSAALRWSVVRVFVKSICSNVSFVATVSLLVFCLVDQSIDVSGTQFLLYVAGFNLLVSIWLKILASVIISDTDLQFYFLVISNVCFWYQRSISLPNELENVPSCLFFLKSLCSIYTRTMQSYIHSRESTASQMYLPLHFVLFFTLQTILKSLMKS